MSGRNGRAGALAARPSKASATALAGLAGVLSPPPPLPHRGLFPNPFSPRSRGIDGGPVLHSRIAVGVHFSTSASSAICAKDAPVRFGTITGDLPAGAIGAGQQSLYGNPYQRRRVIYWRHDQTTRLAPQ
jgi:hypothetical protein